MNWDLRRVGSPALLLLYYGLRRVPSIHGVTKEPQRPHPFCQVMASNGMKFWKGGRPSTNRRALFPPYVTSTARSPTATIVMGGTVGEALGFTVRDLSDQNYAQSLAFCRVWTDIGQIYQQTPHQQIFDAFWNNRMGNSFCPSSGNGELILSTTHLFLRFVGDVESDHTLAPHSSGLRSRLCARSLQEFFTYNLETVSYKMRNYGNDAPDEFYAAANLIAHSANLGYVEESAIRNHILQSLISHPKLYDHQAHALIILFKLAGPTFEAYADPSVVDRCFELLNNQYVGGSSTRMRQVQVRARHPASRPPQVKTNF